MVGKIKFKVVSASSQDGNHRASELNVQNPKTDGWQSKRNCFFPQELIIKLEHRAHIVKIQFLSHRFMISSRIEIQVGDAYDTHHSLAPLSLEKIRFRRLGFQDLTDNERRGQDACELRSVHTDANGTYIKFLLQRNHSHQLNPYNQVGLVAVNIIGEEINEGDFRFEERDGIIEAKSTKEKRKPTEPDLTDDLEFDISQDSEVAEIIRKLQKKKKEAAKNERYSEARELKNMINDLTEVGRELGRLDIDKIKAVDNEDYEEAERRKIELDELRRKTYIRLNIRDLNVLPKSNLASAKDVENVNQTQAVQRLDTFKPKAPPTDESDRGKLPDASSQSNITPATSPQQQPISSRLVADTESISSVPYEDRILPAVAKRLREGETIEDADDQEQEHKEEFLEQRQQQQQKRKPLQLPRQTKKSSAAAKASSRIPEVDKVKQQSPIRLATKEEEEEAMLQMTHLAVSDKKGADIVVDAFGMPIAALLYSSKWETHEKGVQAVDKTMMNLPVDILDRDKALLKLRGAAVVTARAVNDRVPHVLSAGLQLFKDILNKFIAEHSVQRKEIADFLDEVLPCLIRRATEWNDRQIDTVKSCIIETSMYPKVAPLNLVTTACVEPLQQNLPKNVSSRRADLVLSLYQSHGLNNSGLTVQNLMKFALSAMSQTASFEARQKGAELILALYEEVGRPVRLHLPDPRSPEVKNNVLYKALFKSLQEIDDKNGNKAAPPALEFSGRDVNTARDSISYISPRLDATYDKNRDQFQGELRSLHETRRTVQSRFQDSKRLCVFCGEQNDMYDDHKLDRHFYFQCPMLTKCERCKQIVEISELTKHQLVECDHRKDFERCARCTEAIPLSQYSVHTSKHACTVSEERQQHCPLCHTDFGGFLAGGGGVSLDDQWRRHLMGRGPEACRANPRRQDIGKGATTRRVKGEGKRGNVTRRVV